MPDDLVHVRYMVDDVDAAIDFYTTHFGFTLNMSAAPAFADVVRGNLRLLLSGPKSSAGRPMPAMSNAVPWSTLVRKNGSPTVTLTPVSKPMSLIGMWPWSWYWTTTMSKRPWRACMKTVSGGHGPEASMPSPRAVSTAGA